MTITEMLGQSGILTLLGMSVVFGFIIILICCIKLLQIVIHALKLDKESPETVGTVTNSNNVTPTNAVTGQNLAVVAAIATAIHNKELN